MSLDEQKIEITMVLEVLGTPKDKLVPALEEIITSLEKEKGVKVIEKNINEPTELKDTKDIYTNFAEVVVKIDSILLLFAIIFKYMPAHLEISSPEKIIFTKNEFNESVNELIRRLHAYDEVARILQIEKAKMNKKIKELEEGKKEEEKIEDKKN
ncbi:MAG: hypothetical protein KKB31_00880 [Nanoarchaeota archaeon]|nr:hypothetical protein [Nanoarchaeota archaeon]